MEKKPFLTEAMAQQIIEDVPTPFHVYDEKGIRENVRRINKAFSWNKGFKEYFAVKALPNPVILQILKEEGCGVDCSSLTELMLSEACGFTGHEIMFSSNQTPVEDMQKAYELGAYINLDDATMVEFLERVAGVPQEIFCRYNPGGTFQLGESEEQSTPQPSSFRICRMMGLGSALTAKYSRKPLFQLKALLMRRAFSRMPFSS